MTDKKPTPEQEAIIAAALRKENLRIVALAGAAKSTTLQMIAQKVPAIRAMGSLVLAFNKTIQEELSPKLAPMTVKTVNGAGRGAMVKMLGGRPKIDGSKMVNLRKQKMPKAPWEASRVASAAKLRGIIPLEYAKTFGAGLLPDAPEEWTEIIEDLDAPEKAIEPARLLLALSIHESMTNGYCDFDDQVYLPTLFGGEFASQDILMVDEAQDLSPLNHAMLKKIKCQQMIVVGDPLQSIYGFRGAASDAMDQLGRDFSLTDYHLTTCFRCPKAVIREAHHWAPDMRWPEWAIEGAVTYVPSWDDKAQADEQGTDIQWTRKDLPEQITILCRNNAPLIKLALRLAKKEPIAFINNKAASMLLSLLREVCGYKKHWTIDQITARLDEWLGQSLETEDEHKHGSIMDKVDSLRACLEVSTDYESIETTIETLFQSREAKLLFGTGHSSKGKEWPNVAHLDAHLIPAKWARSAEAIQQEENLAYVITTRAQERLIYINSGEFAGR